MRQNNNIPGDTGHFLSTKIDSTDIRNENSTKKMKSNKAEKPHFFRKIFQKILKQTKSSNQNQYLKNIGQRNKSNKIAKNCWLSRYKRSRSSK